jgi:phage FluMu protein Com
MGKIEAPRCKQLGIFDPKGEQPIRIRASNSRPKGRGMQRAVRVQKRTL